MVRNTIHVLPKDTIDKIAAGEVIERPASVVKELIENSIDAKATAISVEIQKGGTSLIRVTDNGIGIPRGEITTAFLRHATSKLNTAEDLSRIHSLGFRGEALASIAAVSEVELLTKCREEEVGSYFTIDGGINGELKDIGTPDGTTFIVRHLFYNTPARKKFLKSDQTEANEIQTLIEHLALSHPEISFHFRNGGKDKLQTSGNSKTEDTVFSVFGKEISKNLLEFHDENDYYTVQGYLGKYTINRGNRNFENFFINGRMVTDKILSRAVEDGYHGFLMQHQFPFLVLFFTFPDGSVDFNVHPSKREVRMDHGKEIYSRLSETVHERLTRREDIQDVRLEDGSKKTEEPAIDHDMTAEPFEEKRLKEVEKQLTEKAESLRKDLPSDFYQPGEFREHGKLDEASTESEESTSSSYPHSYQSGEKGEPGLEENGQMTFFTEKNRPYFNLVGQIFSTYWIIEYQGKVYIIDQHAAHEKVNYERMMKELKESSVTSQMILPPAIVTLEANEIDKLEKYREEFETMGFRFEPFGGKEYKLTGLPANLPDVDPKTLFLSMVASMSDFNSHDTPAIIQEKIASMACKASIKGNQTISRIEAEELIREMLEAKEPFHCPHGRPTMIAVRKEELDKLFRRIV
ncbi:MAG: DNA mismatch repair endonuclease MutL [Lachnospiraceae bacterium]|nr:DNA mismatch repair endonuclease MutL [Lachnospiraceae bacterium]